jgi:predicted phage terminase large subunit-like protein
MTRWAKRDLTGQVIKASAQRGGDEWEVIEFPALFASGNPLWPEFWSKEELTALKTQLPLPKWQAQYQQAPTSEEGALIKRDWWNMWEEDNPPPCEFIIQSWDTAFLKSNRADYSACTTWGVFYHTDEDTGKQTSNIILLDAYRKRMEFPELKEVTFEMYQEWKPDALIVEAKAAGAPLVFELRSMGVPVSEFTPTRGNDKIARVNAVTDIFASGIVWAPPSRWAEEVIEEIAAFPAGDHDDYVDSSTQALLRFRQGGFVRLQSDEEDEEIPWYRKRKAAYY